MSWIQVQNQNYTIQYTAEEDTELLYYLITDLEYDAVKKRQKHLSIDEVDWNFKGVFFVT
jgi:hypothetical protein